MVKVTPRVTIAQQSHNSSDTCSDESNDSFKETNESTKGEKKVPSEQKGDYSKLTHSISINLGNVSMSNSCGSTQLPRIAEEKDSPTGTKSDDYSSSKEISAEKSDKQQSTYSNNQSGDVEKTQNDERQAVSGSVSSQFGGTAAFSAWPMERWARISGIHRVFIKVGSSIIHRRERAQS